MVVASTAVGSYPQWAMQFRHWTLPLCRPYFDQSVVSTSSRYVLAYPSAWR